MSTALEVARQKRAEMKAAGIKPNFTVTFTGEEAAVLQAAASHPGNSYTETSSGREFAKAVALKVASEINAMPKPTRSTKTVEQLEAEAAALLERVAKLKG